MNSNVANLGRNTGRVTAAVYTAGLSELGMSLRKKCGVCGHQMSLHEPEPALFVPAPAPAPQPTLQAQPAPNFTGGGVDALSIADELIKLAGLREVGAISDSEFEVLKAQLMPASTNSPKRTRRPIEHSVTGPVSFTVDGEARGVLKPIEVSELFKDRPRWDEVIGSRGGVSMVIFDQSGSKQRWAVVVQAGLEDGVDQIELGPIEMLRELVVTWVSEPGLVGQLADWEHIKA